MKILSLVIEICLVLISAVALSEGKTVESLPSAQRESHHHHESDIPAFIFKSLPIIAELDEGFEQEFRPRARVNDNAVGSQKVEEAHPVSQIQKKSADGVVRGNEPMNGAVEAEVMEPKSTTKVDKGQLNGDQVQPQHADHSDHSDHAHHNHDETNPEIPGSGEAKQPWTGIGNFIQNLAGFGESGNHGNNNPDQDREEEEDCIKSGASCQTILTMRRCCSGEICRAISLPIFNIMSAGMWGTCP